MCNLDSAVGVCLVIGVQAEECRGLSKMARISLWHKRRGTPITSQVVIRTSCTFGILKTGGAPGARFPKPPCEPHIAGEMVLFSSSSCASVAENRFANEFMAGDDAQLQVWNQTNPHWYPNLFLDFFYQPLGTPWIDLILRLKLGSCY